MRPPRLCLLRRPVPTWRAHPFRRRSDSSLGYSSIPRRARSKSSSSITPDGHPGINSRALGYSGVAWDNDFTHSMILTRILLLTAVATASSGLLYAQGSYEIQVYGSDLVDPGATMFELHSNFTFEGSKTVVDGMYPTEHQLHETLEIT